MCEPEWLAEAIFPDSDGDAPAWVEINATYSRQPKFIRKSEPADGNDRRHKPDEANFLPLNRSHNGDMQDDARDDRHAVAPFNLLSQDNQSLFQNVSVTTFDWKYVSSSSKSLVKITQRTRRYVVVAILKEEVTSVRHWTDRLFSFVVTRRPSFRFEAGQFTMLGLELDGRPLMRAYSISSAPFDDCLEFFSIKVPNGPLTSRLQHLNVGDTLLVGAKTTGTLIPDNLLPGRNLFLLGTGTGFAPFASIIRAPETYDRFERIVVAHGCRRVAELDYSAHVVEEARNGELTGELAAARLLYYPTATRDPFRNQGRITARLSDGSLTRDLEIPPLDPAYDRVMLCGGAAMLSELEAFLRDRGFTSGTSNARSTYAIERAFVEH